ncbi:MAG: hypothetical protein AAFY76_10060 [Cyanobacteria bacterium J06649_11]
MENFYGYDTLLIKKYLSESGHEINLRGSKSRDVYSINVTSKSGQSSTFKIADNWYIASHTYIVWDNDDYIFIRYGCGTNCWGGLVLSLNDNRGIMHYPAYVYSDSIRNLIVYPDSSNQRRIIIENLTNRKQISSELDLCKIAMMPIEMIDSVYLDARDLFVRYKTENCALEATKKINVAFIEY